MQFMCFKTLSRKIGKSAQYLPKINLLLHIFHILLYNYIWSLYLVKLNMSKSRGI